MSITDPDDRMGTALPNPAYSGPLSDTPSKPLSEWQIWFGFHKDPVLLAERQGRWQWYWVIGTTILSLVLAFLLVLAYFALQNFIAGVTNTEIELNAHLEDANSMFIPGNLYSYLFVFFTLGPCLIIPATVLLFLHRGRKISLLTYNIPFSWQPFFKAGWALLVMFVFVVCYYAVFYGNHLTIRDTWLDIWPWFALGMAVFFVQTLGEELFFRGYLVRIWGAVIPYRLIVALIFILVFTSLHLSNPDVKSDIKFMVVYFLMTEALMYWVLFRTRSVMATWGMHWINNCFAVFFSVQPGWDNQLSLFTYTDPVIAAGGSHFLNPWMYLQNLLGIALFILLVTWKKSPFYLEKK